MAEPAKKTYYQLSFTGSQGLVAVFAVLAGLALAFFFGVRAGLTRPQTESAAEKAAVEEAAGEKLPAASPATSSPASVSASASAGSSSAADGATGPSGPLEAPVFEDREAGGQLSNPTTTAPSRTVIASGPEKSKAAEPPAPQVVTPAPKTQRFSVQIVSTSSKSEATKWKDRLAKRGFHVSVVRVDTSKGERFRVRVGPYPDKDKANRALAQLAAEEHVKGWIVPAE